MTNSPADNTDELTARLRLVEDRLHELEQTVHRLSDQNEKLTKREQASPAKEHSPTIDGMPVSAQKEPTDPKPTANEPEQKPPPPPPPKKEEKKPAKPKDIGLEAKIGSYWLNRVGLLAVLIGVVSLLLYSFQFFGAELKIAFGFVLAASIVYLSRSPLMKKSKPAFAHGINALGWSIAFFSGYAMFFVPELKLVDSALLGLFTLIAIAVGTMYDAIESRSEFTASLSTTFAAVSVCLSSSSINPMVALLVIVAAAAYVSVRQNWFSLLIYATVAFYCAFNYAYFHSASLSDFYSASFLIAGWLTIHLSVYFAQKGSEAHCKRQIWTSVLNALFVSGSLANDVQPLLTGASGYSFKIPFALLGSIYFATAKLFKRRDDEDLWTLHLLLGLSFVNISKWVHFTGVSPAVIDIIQLGLLTVVGLRFKIKAFRWFAVFLAFTALFEASSNGWLIGWLSVCIYGSGFYMYRHPLFRDATGPKESAWISNTYLTLANVIASAIISTVDDINSGWKGFFWTLQLLTNAHVVLKTHDVYIRAMTVFMLILDIIYLLAEGSPDNWLPVSLSIALLYGFAGYCRNIHLETSEPTAQKFKERYGLLAGIVLMCFLWRSVPGQLASIALGVQGMVSIVGGFNLKEKLLRISGLVAFGVMALHLLFIDLASASTIARIISFIIAGLLLVGCSYAYAEFSKKLTAPEKNSTDGVEVD